jgi:hypothetical protein
MHSAENRDFGSSLVPSAGAQAPTLARQIIDPL